MEILTRKYGKEWTVGFFLRGGAMASQYHTELNDASSLARLMASIQQMVGSRRNMHNDKLLPKGVTLAAPSAPFASVQISELLRNNARDVFSLMGVPPVAVGDTDGVNYASADQQMKFFWHATILPYQKIYTSCIMNNEIVKTFFKPGQYIVFDNSGNSYLDDFSDKLTQDAGLAPILTVDERRKRLGYEAIGDDRGAKLESELSSNNAGLFSLSMEKKTAEPAPEVPPEPEFPSIIKRIAQDEPATKEAWDFVMAEVKEWEKIALASLESQDDAHKSIQGRANEYGRAWSKLMNAEVMSVWDAQLAMLGTPEAKGIRGALEKGEKEDRLVEFRARSVDFLLRQVAAEAEGRFAGFSETWTKRIYLRISELMGKNYLLSDIASDLKTTTFGQYYEGQMKTVVNTEFRSSLHKGSSRFGSDLSKVAKTLSKIWMARIDPATRDSHVELDGRAISGDARDVAEMSFVPGITLRYPMDGAAPAGEVINCRCAMRYKVLEWRD
jgi:hypothetical protein